MDFLKTLLLGSVFLAAFIWKVNSGRNRSISNNSNVGKAISGFYMSNGKCTYFDRRPTGNVRKCRPIRKKSAKRAKTNATKFRKKTLHLAKKQNDVTADSAVNPGKKVKGKRRRVKLRRKDKPQTGRTRIRKVKKVKQNANFEAKEDMPNDEPIVERTQGGQRVKNEKSRTSELVRVRKVKKAGRRRKKVTKAISPNMTNDEPTFKRTVFRKKAKNGTVIKKGRKNKSRVKTLKNSNQTAAANSGLNTNQSILTNAQQTLIYEPRSTIGKCYKYIKGRKIVQPESMCFHYEWAKVKGRLKCRKIIVMDPQMPAEDAPSEKCPNLVDTKAMAGLQMDAPYSKSLTETEQFYAYNPSSGCQPLSSPQESNKSKRPAFGKVRRKSGKIRRNTPKVGAKRRRQKRMAKRAETSNPKIKQRKRTKTKVRRAIRPKKHRKLRQKNSGNTVQKGNQIIYKSRKECIMDNPQSDDPAAGESAAPATYGVAPNKTADAKSGTTGSPATSGIAQNNKTADTKVEVTDSPASKTDAPDSDKPTEGSKPDGATTAETETDNEKEIPILERKTCSGIQEFVMRISEENCEKAGDDCDRMPEEELQESLKKNPEYLVKKFVITKGTNVREIDELECLKSSKCRLCSEEDFAAKMEQVAERTKAPVTNATAKTTQASKKTAATIKVTILSATVAHTTPKSDPMTKKARRWYKRRRSGGWGGCCSSNSKKDTSETEDESVSTTEQSNSPDSALDFVSNPAPPPDLADLICALHSGKQILTVCLVPMDLNANSECFIQHGNKKGLCFDPNLAAQETVNQPSTAFASKSRKWKSLKTSLMKTKQDDLSGLINKETLEILLQSFDSNDVIENTSETTGLDKCETIMRSVPVSELVYEKIAKECSFDIK